ncbi:MAG: alpha/beta hydrolase [Candidatus Kapabacteria bacterium]|nr:alpha/beta hydrolase [Candidatus Kapabacteria bacterium]
MIIRILISVIIAAVLGGCSMDSFLFNTMALDTYDLSTSVIPAEHRTEVTLRSGSETLYGYFVRQPDSLRIDPHPTVFYNHGNKHNLQEYWDRVELLYKAGFDVFIYDYRGFGRSTGSSSEEGLQSDVSAALAYLKSRPDVDTTQIVDYGFSLGGYPCLYAASTLHRPKAVITEAIFASSEAIIQSGTLLNVPGGYLMKGAFNNLENIRRIAAPILLLHGTDDVFIGIERNGEPLAAAAPQPKIFRRIEGAGHSSIPSTMGEDAYIELVRSFIRGR